MPEKAQDKMQVLGLMSGTSLDGLDMALCEFEHSASGYSYKLLAAKTIEYSQEWKKKLAEVKSAGSEVYFALHAAYGKYIATEINTFLAAIDLKPALIASHGHTVFHQPEWGFSTQIGCGATIAALTGITTVNDFRSLDVAMGGQGAPLVPVGDALLFSEYEACLNIGGIANISFDARGKRIAYDICVANMLLNFLAERAGKPFDANGGMAAAGKVNYELLETLNTLPYYSQKGAKSIGREWFEEQVKPLLGATDDIHSLLATSSEHIATIIAAELNEHKLNTVLVTGGGAFNTGLIETLRSKTKCRIVVPEHDVINFKEALIFAFLGYLRVHKQINTLSSVTGALGDSIGGAVYLS